MTVDSEGVSVIASMADKYIHNMSEEAIFINTIGAGLVGLAILVPCIVRCPSFRQGLQTEGGYLKA